MYIVYGLVLNDSTWMIQNYSSQHKGMFMTYCCMYIVYGLVLNDTTWMIKNYSSQDIGMCMYMV